LSSFKIAEADNPGHAGLKVRFSATARPSPPRKRQRTGALHDASRISIRTPKLNFCVGGVRPSRPQRRGAFEHRWKNQHHRASEHFCARGRAHSGPASFVRLEQPFVKNYLTTGRFIPTVR
jgi:hypothetical protein